MRKTYSKPEIIFEDFTLNESIAGNCDVKTFTPAQRQCGFDFGGIFIFMENITGCELKFEDDGTNGVCYHVPTEDNTLFNS